MNDQLTLFDDVLHRQISSSSTDCADVINQKVNTAAVSDHDYSRRSTSTSDSGIQSDNPNSPQFSDTTDSVYSPHAASPTPSADSNKVIENDCLLQTLDAECLINSDDLLSKLADDSNFTLDLDGEKY